VRKFWRVIALILAVLAGSVNAVACVEQLARGHALNAATSLLIVAIQPTLYRIMVGGYA